MQETGHHTGENNPRWNGGGENYYGPNWVSQRRNALERDDYRCQDPSCSMTNEEHIEKHGQGLDVHHIIPFDTFDSPSEANKLENLVTLCRECHHSTWQPMSPLRPAPASD